MEALKSPVPKWLTPAISLRSNVLWSFATFCMLTLSARTEQAHAKWTCVQFSIGREDRRASAWLAGAAVRPGGLPDVSLSTSLGGYGAQLRGASEL